MKIVKLKRRWHKWKCPYCGIARLTSKNEGSGKDKFACPHYVASLIFSKLSENNEILTYMVNKITRLSSMEDWGKTKMDWGLTTISDEDEGRKYLEQIMPDIEVRIISSDDDISLNYLSFYYKEEGAPYQNIE